MFREAHILRVCGSLEDKLAASENKLAMSEQQNEDLETEAGKLGQALEKMDAEGLRLEEELAEVIKSCSPQLSPVEFPVSLSLDTPSDCMDCIAERRSLLHDAMNAKVLLCLSCLFDCCWAGRGGQGSSRSQHRARAAICNRVGATSRAGNVEKCNVQLC